MKHFVGEFNQEQLEKGEDKKLISKLKKELNLQFILSKIVKKKGVTYLKVWLTNDFNLVQL